MFKKIPCLKPVDNQDGSIIVIAIMVLAIMTVIGLMSADTTVTENFIIRNVGLHKQNVQMVEAGIMEGLQDIVQRQTTAELEILKENPPTGITAHAMMNVDTAWEEDPPGVGNSQEQDWYDPMTGRALDAGVNWVVPNSIQNDGISIINTRGEKAVQPLRMAMVGWRGAKGSSLKATAPTRHAGKILAEYLSGNGMVRMEVGIEKVF